MPLYSALDIRMNIVYDSLRRVRFIEQEANYRVSRQLVYKPKPDDGSILTGCQMPTNLLLDCYSQATAQLKNIFIFLFSGALQSSRMHTFDKHGKMNFLSVILKWTWAEAHVPVSPFRCLFPPILPQLPSYFLVGCCVYECYVTDQKVQLLLTPHTTYMQYKKITRLQFILLCSLCSLLVVKPELPHKTCIKKHL